MDLKTRAHRPGQPGDLITRTLAVDYDADATCPDWDKFIARILPGALGGYVQRVAGYSLTGSTDDGAFYFCHGAGKNGKSNLIKALAEIFNDYAGHARAEMIEEPRNGASPKHDLAALPGVRFLHSEETTDGGRFRTGTMKSIATGEPMTGEAKYCAPFTFKPVAKLWIGGNHKPRMDGGDFGFVRRIRLIPFTQRITEEEEIPEGEMLASFRAEAAGILNWMLAGLAMWRVGFTHAPSEVREATAEYRQSEDELGDFITQCTQPAEDHWHDTTKKVAYDAYCRWADSEGNKQPLSFNTFTRRMQGKGWKLNAGRRYWRGKSIKREEEWGEDESSDCVVAPF